MHDPRRRCSRQRAQTALRSSVRNERRQRFAHRPKAIGPDVECIAPGELPRPNAGFCEVVGVHELEAIVATTEQVYRATLAHPFEQDLKNAQAPMTEDRARAHNRDLESLLDVPR